MLRRLLRRSSGADSAKPACRNLRATLCGTSIWWRGISKSGAEPSGPSEWAYQTAEEAFKHRGRPVDEFSQIIGADVADATLEGFIQYATAALRVRLDRRDTGRL
nr:hypothetical protein [Pseudomonas sp. Os17]